MTVPVPRSTAIDAEAAPFPLSPATRVSGPKEAADELRRVIAERTGIELLTESRSGAPATIRLRVEPGPAAESYRLAVDADGVEIVGADPAGLFYGVQTLRQLITRRGDDWVIPAAEISDAPRFAHRGFMLDVARTFFPVDTVLAVIDRASALKLNVLHLHLTDDQGWRLEMRSRPLLTERASTTAACGRPGGFYTHDDYRRIIEYAAAHHITVIPEIDLPGHTHAIGLAHPELVEAPVHNDALRELSTRFDQELPQAGVPYQGWGVGHSSVRIGAEETYAFLADVLGELAELTPGPYLHIGGDEALGTDPADFDAFMARVTRMVTDLGKTPMAWHEAGSAEVAPGTVGQFWGASTPSAAHAAHAARFVEREGALVLSPHDTAYVDMKPTADFPLGLDWAGITDLRRAYDWEPTAVLPEIPESSLRGVEAPMWAETLSTIADIDQLFFPRVAAVAEVAWSTADSRDWESFRTRVGALGALWDAAGWDGHRPAEITWSA